VVHLESVEVDVEVAVKLQVRSATNISAEFCAARAASASGPNVSAPLTNAVGRSVRKSAERGLQPASSCAACDVDVDEAADDESPEDAYVL